MKFFSKIGSIKGSNSSPTFSMRRGVENFIHISSVLPKSSTSLNEILFKFLSYFLIIQLNACNYGSIQRGYRDALLVKIPFCTESISLGSPCEFQTEISTSEVSIDST